MSDVLLTSLQNPRVKRVVKLRLRRTRDRERAFLIEGYRELLRAVDAGFPLEELWICRALFLGDNEPDLIARARAAGADIVECTDPVFHKLAYRDRPDGLLAVAPQPEWTLERLPKVDAALYVIAVAIEKPGNLGTILRTADAVGANGVIVCDRCTDLFNPNVVRASVGTLFTVPVAEADSDTLLSWLRERGVEIVATTPHAETSYTSGDWRGSLAIVVGSEQYGLPERWLSETDRRVRIPMAGVADSLNAAIATAVMLFEVVRQRVAEG